MGIPNCCSQRNKDETIISVIKRLFGEHITSRLEDTEQRIIIQMHRIQYPQTDQYCCDILWWHRVFGYEQICQQSNRT